MKAKRRTLIMVSLLVCAAIAGFAFQPNVPSYADEGGGLPPASVTAPPEAIADLIYTAEPQELATAGTATDGTMQYALENVTGGESSGLGDWGEAVPKATKAGTYRVWYKAVGDANHSDSEPAFITARIAKRKLIITPTTRVYDYNGEIQGPGDIAYEDPADLAEMVHLDGLQGDDVLYNICIDGQGQEVGTYPLIATQANLDEKVDNYDREYVEGKMIIRGTLEVTVTGSSAEKTYNGAEQAYEGSVTATSSNEAFDASKFRYTGNTVAKGTEPGDYVVQLDQECCVYDDELYKLKCTLGDPIKLTIKPASEPEVEPATTTIGGVLLATVTAKGSNGLALTWNKIDGVGGYDVFFVKCGKAPFKKVKTIKGNKTFKWTKRGLKKGKAYRAYVKAWVMEGGKKKYVKTSLSVHAYTSGGTSKYTNAKSVTVKKARVSLKVGKTHKIKAKVTKLKAGKKLMPAAHAPKLRYVSSDEAVATVSASGKITAKAKGSCKVYAIASNGAKKAIKLTVKFGHRDSQ